MKRLTVSKDVQVILDGKKYLLEEGDIVLIEGNELSDEELDEIIIRASKRSINEARLSTSSRVKNVNWYVGVVKISNDFFDRIKARSKVLLKAGKITRIPHKEKTATVYIERLLKSKRIVPIHIAALIKNIGEFSVIFDVEVALSKLSIYDSNKIENSINDGQYVRTNLFKPVKR